MSLPFEPQPIMAKPTPRKKPRNRGLDLASVTETAARSESRSAVATAPAVKLEQLTTRIDAKALRALKRNIGNRKTLRREPYTLQAVCEGMVRAWLDEHGARDERDAAASMRDA